MRRGSFFCPVVEVAIVTVLLGCHAGAGTRTQPDAATSDGNDETPADLIATDDLVEVKPESGVDAGGDNPVDSGVDAESDLSAGEVLSDVPLDISLDSAADLSLDSTLPREAGVSCEAGSCLAVESVVAGGGSTCALFKGGRIKCWGSNVYGLLGLGDERNRGDQPGEMGDNLPFIDLGVGRSVVKLALGVGHACALLDNGQVKCWGGNTFGQLGLGDSQPRGSRPNQMGDNLPAVDLGQGRKVVAMSAGSYQTCALFDNGQVGCWGDNQDNKLGVTGTSPPFAVGDQPGEMGDNLPIANLGAGRTALALALGVGHTCALLDNHQIRCWGGDYWGELGRGGMASGTINLGTGRSAVDVTAGHGHTCALLDNAQVKCWGRNEFGELGLGDLVNRGDLAADMGDNLPALDLGTGRVARSVLALNGYTCAVLDNDAIKCWGEDSYGQLGLGNTSRPGTMPGQMGDKLLAADLAPSGPLRVFSAHVAHNCALFEGGRLVCWGMNTQGELGLGDANNRGDGPSELGAFLPSPDLGM